VRQVGYLQGLYRDARSTEYKIHLYILYAAIVASEKEWCKTWVRPIQEYKRNTGVKHILIWYKAMSLGYNSLRVLRSYTIVYSVGRDTEGRNGGPF